MGGGGARAGFIMIYGSELVRIRTVSQLFGLHNNSNSLMNHHCKQITHNFIHVAQDEVLRETSIRVLTPGEPRGS